MSDDAALSFTLQNPCFTSNFEKIVEPLSFGIRCILSYY